MAALFEDYRILKIFRDRMILLDPDMRFLLLWSLLGGSERRANSLKVRKLQEIGRLFTKV